MSVLINGTAFGTWGAYTRYAYVSGTVNRNNNTVTLTSLEYQFTAANAYATGLDEVIYIRANDNATVLSTTGTRWNFSGGTSPVLNLYNTNGVTVAATTTSYTFYLASSDGSSIPFTVEFSSGGSGPSGGSITNVSNTSTSFTATISLTTWGSGGTQKKKQLRVYKYPDSVVIQGLPYYYAEDLTSSLSETFTVNNNSSTLHDPQFTIGPNGAYDIGLYADDGIYMYRLDYASNPIVIPPPAATISSGGSTDTTITVNYSAVADNGYYDKTIECSIDGGTTWVTIGTVTGGGASTGSYSFTGLTPNTTYTVQTRTTTPAGSTAGTSIAITTTGVRATLYGSAGGQSKKIVKLYGSVNGQSRLIKKLYASVGGVTKLVFEDPDA